VEKLDRREALLDDGRGVESLASLEADIQGIRPDVPRQEAAGHDLPRRVQREAALEVLQKLFVRVVPDRQHSSKAPGKIVGDVIEADLPPGLWLERVDAE
jgi:hypothetical protein